MTKNQFKALIQRLFGSNYKVICLTEREINETMHYEWVVICKITNVVEALFAATDTCLYSVQYVSMSELDTLAKLKQELCSRRK